MLLHNQLGQTDFAQKRKLVKLIQSGEITLGGYTKTKIYGTLTCRSGKRMKVDNRIFFFDEEEAIDAGYRPCGHCMPRIYQIWKALQAVKQHQQ
ncbi:Ada metal-binding domain-containing protein [Mucilaginibacter polytrichastri]|nr:Ada metal-binding domain-containing protein [Mucilaginibacter polytrichastri]